MEYEFSKLEHDKIETLKKLHKDCFNSKYTSAYFNAKYDTSAYHEDLFGFFNLDKGGNAAAYYGIFPTCVNYKGHKMIASQSGDTMTHPDHRGKGLFMSLAQKTYEYASAKGINFVFGFTNSKSHRGFEKIGWTFTGKWCVYTLKNNLPNTSLIYRKIPFIKNIFTSWLKNKETNWKEINWKIYSPSGVSGYVIKDDNFFDYKKYSEAKIYSINGFYIYLKINPHLLIGDVSYFQEEEMKNFIETIKFIARKSLVKTITIQVSKNHWLAGYLQNIGIPFVDSGSTIGYFSFTKTEFEFENFMHIHADADYF